MDNRVRWLMYALLALAVAWVLLPGGFMGPAQISFSRFMELARNDKVSEVTLQGHSVEGRLRSQMQIGAEGKKTDRFRTHVPEVGQPGILSVLEKNGVQVNVKPPRDGGWGWLLFLLPWLLIVGAYIWFWRRMTQQQRGDGGGGGMPGMFGLGQSKLKQVKPEESNVRFDDVAGQDAAKRDVQEVVEFLREPEAFRELGAELPRGLLLIGPPGTGKTLTARAVAGEAGVPFFHTAGSEFIEMVVGVGASRVRQMFEEAKQQQPSIVFIDEFDAIGRQRGTGMGGGHDEREQTLNQILNEMDGFAGKDAVIVIAATNRPDVLDPALVRPGRFDRRLVLDLPDRQARRQILDIQAKDTPLAKDVDLDEIAAATPGFSGADLENLVNEAAMVAARDQARRVSRGHFLGARDKVMMGPERPLTIDDAQKHRLAVHESGHTAVSWFLDNADPPMKVTIVPRGQALGGTHQIPEKERYVADEAYLRDRLAVIMAGRVCEEAFLGSLSSGAEDDIRQATHLARSMVVRWGMVEDLGPIDLSQQEENPFLGREMTSARQFSDQTAREVDKAVKALIAEASDRARDVIEAHRDRVKTLIRTLEDAETLDRPAIRDCLADPAGTSGESDSRECGRRANVS